VIITATDWENLFALRCPRYSIVTGIESKPDKNGAYKTINTIFRSRKDVLKANHNFSENTELQWLNMNEGQAEIHMMALAEAMWDAMNESTPQELKEGEWHIPFGDKIDYHKLLHSVEELKGMKNDEFIEDLSDKKETEYKLKIATARCARVSYTVVGEEDKVDNYKNDIKLHDRLASSGHWSPFEHCAQANNNKNYSGNFKGFTQYRKTFNKENITC
ncbi:MAG: hypothetical protein PHY59_09625, partial [Methanobacterium sp.]|nr:hypothetical protein [Methanobacterium sp.]